MKMCYKKKVGEEEEGGGSCIYSKIFCKTVKVYRACENALLHQQDAKGGGVLRNRVTFVDGACGSF